MKLVSFFFFFCPLFLISLWFSTWNFYICLGIFWNLESKWFNTSSRRIVFFSNFLFCSIYFVSCFFFAISLRWWNTKGEMIKMRVTILWFWYGPQNWKKAEIKKNGKATMPTWVQECGSNVIKEDHTCHACRSDPVQEMFHIYTLYKYSNAIFILVHINTQRANWCRYIF